MMISAMIRVNRGDPDGSRSQPTNHVRVGDGQIREGATSTHTFCTTQVNCPFTNQSTHSDPIKHWPKQEDLITDNLHDENDHHTREQTRGANARRVEGRHEHAPTFLPNRCSISAPPQINRLIHSDTYFIDTPAGQHATIKHHHSLQALYQVEVGGTHDAGTRGGWMDLG